MISASLVNKESNRKIKIKSTSSISLYCLQVLLFACIVCSHSVGRVESRLPKDGKEGEDPKR
jgi:hypothetical protein